MTATVGGQGVQTEQSNRHIPESHPALPSHTSLPPTMPSPQRVKHPEQSPRQYAPPGQPSVPSHASLPSTMPLPHVVQAEQKRLQISGAEQPVLLSQVSDPAMMPSPQRGAHAEQELSQYVPALHPALPSQVSAPPMMSSPHTQLSLAGGSKDPREMSRVPPARIAMHPAGVARNTPSAVRSPVAVAWITPGT
jgi:hypothetical protein